ncbi:uncharacterized protein LOC126745544 [Anthonomus grandis grandis]|uniref:uncharacterized protein LOC126745544 n=1 Tax=Anthonomus grandis grandis TaxID=2921223 RepID=UPI00216501F3|nr:uncharacterized protein LOC126745544 [Anthonomus grandis grandis]
MSFRTDTFIIIRYGPYNAYGTIDHRTQKLTGLCGALTGLGYEFILVPINEYNRMSVEIYDREIFRCDIRNLMFNMPIEEDPVGQRALAAIEEARRRMCAVESEDNQETQSAKGTSTSSVDPTKAFSNEVSELLPFDEENIQHKSLSGRAIREEVEEKIGKVKIMVGEKADVESNQLHELFEVGEEKPEGDVKSDLVFDLRSA